MILIPQNHETKCTDGFEPSRAVLQTAPATRPCAQMDSVRVERTPADFQSAAATESAYCPDHPHGTRTRISTLRGWLPGPFSRGDGMTPVRLELNIPALKGL